jgi:hypothetical protein
VTSTLFLSRGRERGDEPSGRRGSGEKDFALGRLRRRGEEGKLTRALVTKV